MTNPLRRLLSMAGAATMAVATSLALAAAPAQAAESAPTSINNSEYTTLTAQLPVSRPDTKSCTVTIADHYLSNADDGSPQRYSGTYTPPEDCAGPWAKVVLDSKVTVSGRQFDRTGDLTIGGVPVWYGTTQEPRGETPTEFSFSKDVTDFTALLQKSAPFEGGYGNYTDDTYTGIYDQTVTLTFYQADAAHPAPDTPDEVVSVPIPDLSPDAPSADVELSDLPRNITRARLDVVLKGNGCDEQWFSAVPDAVAAQLPEDAACAGGPYREAAFAVDGTGAGALGTYPHIYSGGIVPSLWRPVLAINTLDLRPESLDLTPFVGELVDGKSHTLSVGMEPDRINDTWYLPAVLFLETDDELDQTSGAVTDVDVQPKADVTETVQDASDATGAQAQSEPADDEDARADSGSDQSAGADSGSDQSAGADNGSDESAGGSSDASDSSGSDSSGSDSSASDPSGSDASGSDSSAGGSGAGDSGVSGGSADDPTGPAAEAADSASDTANDGDDGDDGDDGGDEVAFSVDAVRSDSVTGYVDTSAGRVTTTTTFDRAFHQDGSIADEGMLQHVKQADRIAQSSVSTGEDGTTVRSHTLDETYLLTMDFSAEDYVDDTQFTLEGAVTMGQQVSSSTTEFGCTTDRAWNWKLSTDGSSSRAPDKPSTSDGNSETSYQGTDDAGNTWDTWIRSKHLGAEVETRGLDAPVATASGPTCSGEDPGAGGEDPDPGQGGGAPEPSPGGDPANPGTGAPTPTPDDQASNSRDRLPRTGASVVPLAVVAAVLLAAGTGLVTASRRRAARTDR